MAILSIVVLLAVGYAILMFAYYQAWVNFPEQACKTSPVNIDLLFSVVIPARNEASHIVACLQSIAAQHFPQDKFEVLVVDDESIDDTVLLAEKMKHAFKVLRVLPNNGKGKKKAIETAIANSKGNWVVTTDADCIVGPGWLSAVAETIVNTKANFIAGPVLLQHTGGLLSIFQLLDFMMMQGITAASVHKGWHNMCNGANLAYRKDAFSAVNGFAGIDNVPTGDDMLLMHKIDKSFPKSTSWLKNRQAIAQTEACPTIASFLQQRIRWGSKATVFEDKRIFWVLLLVYLFNFSIIAIGVWSIFYQPVLPWVIGLTIFKVLAEWPLMYGVAGFFCARRHLPWFILLQPVHGLYIVLAGWLGQFGSYTWKGRVVRKS